MDISVEIWCKDSGLEDNGGAEVDASLELVITTVTWWSRSRFGSMQFSDNGYSICLMVQWQIH